MKKLIVSILAVAALGAGAAASAQVVGIPGPTVALNPFPYMPPDSGMLPGGAVYKDPATGDLVYVDPRNVHMRLDLGRSTDIYGRTTYVDRHGRAVAVDGGVLADVPQYNAPVPRARERDRDGDGVPNRRDRFPEDPRYR